MFFQSQNFQLCLLSYKELRRFFLKSICFCKIEIPSKKLVHFYFLWLSLFLYFVQLIAAVYADNAFPISHVLYFLKGKPKLAYRAQIQIKWVPFHTLTLFLFFSGIKKPEYRNVIRIRGSAPLDRNIVL